MQTEVSIIYYAIATVIFAALGAITHVVRGTFNVFPDRISDKPLMDVFVSDGYSWQDYFFGTEYDDAGYYRLDSLKNLRIHCVGSMIGGLIFMLFRPGVDHVVEMLINAGAEGVWHLFLRRLHEVGNWAIF